MIIGVKEPGKPWTTRDVEDDLHSYQAIVGGYIEHFHSRNGLAFFCNEDGKFMDLHYNFRFYSDFIMGTVFAARSDEEGEFIDLTASDVSWLKTEPQEGWI